MKILVADDTPRALAKLGEMLESLGCEVLRAGDGVEAVKVFQEHGDTLDLIILDYAMPELDGFGAYQQMVELGPTVPVAFVAGVSKAAIEPTAKTFNAIKVLQKPVKINSLEKLVAKVNPEFQMTQPASAPTPTEETTADGSAATLEQFQQELSGSSEISGGGAAVSSLLSESSDLLSWDGFNLPEFLAHTQLRFGEYLFRRGLVTDEQLLNARREQLKTQVPLGAMGIERGWLTRRQVQTILETQKQDGGRFGDVAVEQGMLTKEQRDTLIERQQQVTRRMGEMLVDQGVLQPADLDPLLAEFSRLLDEPVPAVAAVKV